MNVIRTAIPEVVIIEPKVFGDARGFFFESFNQKAFNEATGTNHPFVQDNHSRSAQGVLRGLHYQIQQPQGKLVRVVRASWRCCSLVSRTKAVWKACVPTSILDIDTEQAISLPSGRRKVASR